MLLPLSAMFAEGPEGSPRESMEVTGSTRLRGYLRRIKVERTLLHSALKPSVSGNIIVTIVFHKPTS